MPLLTRGAINLTLQNKFLLLIIIFLVLSWLFILHYKLIENKENLVASKIFNNKSPDFKIIFKNGSLPSITSSAHVIPIKTKNILQLQPVVKKAPSVLHAVTYASHGGRDDRFCRAIESAIRHNYDIVILGWGLKWKGLSQKLEAAQKYALSLPKDDIILFTDAFDVLFTDSSEKILDKFYSLNHEILFAGECGCWPHIMDEPQACFEKYPKSPTPYRYLNSGTWIGKASIAEKMLSEVMKLAGSSFDNANDQKLVADMYMSGKFGIAVDFNATIFQSMHMTLDPPLPKCYPYKDLILTNDGHWYNKRTNQYPAVFHFNGGGKTHHLEMEGKMWYKNSKYNSIKEIEKLSKHILNVPTKPSNSVTFSDICYDYIKRME